jgi:hypothetical protein
MRRYLFVSNACLPVVVFAEDKRAARAYVRELLGFAHDAPLPRHVVVSVA